VTIDRAAGLQVARDGPALHLTLDRPEKANALNAALVDALLTQVNEAAAAGVRLLVLRGHGRHFCAGFDFSGFESLSEGDLLLRFVRIEQLLQAVHYAPFHTLALAHGLAIGAGADLFAACATRVATAESSFTFPGVRFGLILGSRRLAQRIGTSQARQLLAGGETLDGMAADRIGLVTQMANSDTWPALVDAQAQQAQRLDEETQAALHRMTVEDTRAADMAELVASAARPGLKERIRDYRATVTRT